MNGADLLIFVSFVLILSWLVYFIFKHDEKVRRPAGNVASTAHEYATSMQTIEDKYPVGIAGKGISNKLAKFLFVKNNRIKHWRKNSETYLCELCESVIYKTSLIYEHIFETQHRKNVEKSRKNDKPNDLRITHFHCRKCERQFEMCETLLQCHCLSHLFGGRMNFATDMIRYNSIGKQEMQFECVLCDSKLDSESDLSDHLESQPHVQRYDYFAYICLHCRKFSSPCHGAKMDEPIDISISQAVNTEEDLLFKSAGSITHTKLQLNNRIMSGPSEFSQAKEFVNDLKFYKCFLCDTSFFCILAFTQHFQKSTVHKERLTYFLKNAAFMDTIRRLDYDEIDNLLETNHKEFERALEIASERDFPDSLSCTEESVVIARESSITTTPTTTTTAATATIQTSMNIRAQKLFIDINRYADILVQESNALIKSDKHGELRRSAEWTVSSVYPQARAYLFGSGITSLCLQNSDVNIFLDCGSMYHENGSIEKSQEYVGTVRKFFKRDRKTWTIQAVMERAKVPLIKLKHKNTKLACDISFFNGLAVEKSKLIRAYAMAYPLCRQLILFLKEWLKANDFHGADGLSGHAISWLAIFFLQTIRVLPSVHQLIELKNQSNIVAGWQCGFLEEFHIKPFNYSFSQMLKAFFEYYAEFDYLNMVACPLLGKILAKKDFSNINNLPLVMSMYYRRELREQVEAFPFNCPMVIQDPIDLSQNITKTITRDKLTVFRIYCTESYNHI